MPASERTVADPCVLCPNPAKPGNFLLCEVCTVRYQLPHEDGEREAKLIVIPPEPLGQRHPACLHSARYDLGCYDMDALPPRPVEEEDSRCLTNYPAPVCTCGRYRLMWIAPVASAP
jgi:hypothetical protein